MPASAREILLASPRGFCAGVSYAVEIVELCLARHGAPVWVRHEIVHNRRVVEDLRAQGARFVDDLADVPAGSLLVFSAHGVSPRVREEAAGRGLRVIDATCPLVTRVHRQVLRLANDGYEIVMIGHRGHVEVEGTMGHAPDRMHLVETEEDVAALVVRDPARLAVVTQTTLSVDDTRSLLAALQARFPLLRLPEKDDICYATQNRQGAVKELARQCDRLLVIGSPTSSNARRLVEVSERAGCPAELVESADSLEDKTLAGAQRVGVTAGASTPEPLVQGVLERLRQLGFSGPREVSTAVENVHFPLPKALRPEA